MSNIINFDNVWFSYEAEDELLKGVTFSVNEGEYVCLLGHNGSGKSTIARLLVGLLAPVKGQILFNDLIIDEDNITKIREKIGIVFQNPDNQFVGVTVKDDIAFGLENRRIPYDEMNKRIDYYANLVHMSDFLDRNPEDLSGGQKQRVAIASVLAFEPEVIIFDEATSMLDPKGVREVNETIKNLIGKKTIISITHNLNEAIYADRVIILDDGKIILNDKPEEVFKQTEILKKANLDVTESMKLIEAVNNTNMQKEMKERISNYLWELNFHK